MSPTGTRYQLMKFHNQKSGQNNVLTKINFNIPSHKFVQGFSASSYLHTCCVFLLCAWSFGAHGQVWLGNTSYISPGVDFVLCNSLPLRTTWLAYNLNDLDAEYDEILEFHGSLVFWDSKWDFLPHFRFKLTLLFSITLFLFFYYFFTVI